jgi:hypothetical protein
MVYYNKSIYNLLGYRKSRRKNKMYDAVLQNKKNNKFIYVPFGDNRYENYQDNTGLNLYPKLIHNDKERRRLYRLRHNRHIKKGYFSPSFFSYFILW